LQNQAKNSAFNHRFYNLFSDIFSGAVLKQAYRLGQLALPQVGGCFTNKPAVKNAQVDLVQGGRSMIEMLGVLAIIGVLSVGGIAGYSKAMMKFKINKTISQVTQIAANIQTLYKSQGDYNNLLCGGSGDTYDITLCKKAKLAPDDVFQNEKMVNPFGGELAVHTMYDNYGAFQITMNHIPTEACIELLSIDWGATSTGLVAISSRSGWYGTPKETSCTSDSYNGLACKMDGNIPAPISEIVDDYCRYDDSELRFMFY
jgi:type II secretory pathway pseudopilin PulG